jgi:hypothetical protein
MIEMMVLLMNDRHGLTTLCFSYWDVICRLRLPLHVGICVTTSLALPCLIATAYGSWAPCLRMHDSGRSHAFGLCLPSCLLFHIWYRVGYGYILKIYDDALLIKERIPTRPIARRTATLI